MDDHIFDYSLVLPHVYIGSDLCRGNICPVHGGEFEELGILVEINLSVEKKEIPPDGIDIYAWIPVPDDYAPTVDQLNMGTAIIHEALSSHKNVYVHCKHGHGRSPSLVAAYLIRYKGYNAEQALDCIKSKRAEIHPVQLQIDALIAYESLWLK